MIAKISMLRNWTPSRLPRQFSLRAIFVVTTIVALVAGVYRFRYDLRMARERRFVQLINEFSDVIGEQNDAEAIAAVAHKIEIEFSDSIIALQIEHMARLVIHRMQSSRNPDGSSDDGVDYSGPPVENSIMVVRSQNSDNLGSPE